MPEEVKAQGATQVFCNNGENTLITGSFPAIVDSLGLDRNYYAIQTKEQYETSVRTDGSQRLKTLVPLSKVLDKLEAAAAEHNPSHTQGLTDASILTRVPFTSSNIYLQLPESEELKNGGYNISLNRPKSLIHEFSVSFFNNKDELCAFSIQKFKYKNEAGQFAYASNVAVITNLDKTPSMREVTFLSSVKMLPASAPATQNIQKNQKVSIHAINETIKSSINSTTFSNHINLDRLLENTADSFQYLQAINGCFVEEGKEPDYNELKRIRRETFSETLKHLPEKTASAIKNMFIFIMENPYMALGLLAAIAVTIMIVLTYGTAAGDLGASITGGALDSSSIEAVDVGVGVVAGAALGVAGLGAFIRHKFFKPADEPEDPPGAQKTSDTPTPTNSD